jgi:hypothetical protein
MAPVVVAPSLLWGWGAWHLDDTLASRPGHGGCDRLVEAALLSALTLAPMLEVSANGAHGEAIFAVKANALSPSCHSCPTRISKRTLKVEYEGTYFEVAVAITPSAYGKRRASQSDWESPAHRAAQNPYSGVAA